MAQTEGVIGGEGTLPPTSTSTDTSGGSNALGGRSRVILPQPPPHASDLLNANAPEKKLYWDRSHYDSPESQMIALSRSSTLYVGNLAFSTRTSHLRALFGTLGPVAAVRMGLDRYKKTPCGFAFVEYGDRRNALHAVSYLTGMKLDGRVIRVELDAGFKPGRQYGRGVSGGQVRDDRRATIDPARSGSGGAGGGGGGGRTPRGVGGGGGTGNIPATLRWEAPPRSDSGGGRGGGGDHYGPATSGGSKRDRDDDNDQLLDDDMGHRSTKNPRFREDGSDDDM